MLGYGARVFQEITNNPNAGGGPIRRSPLLAFRTRNDGDMVWRTPHAVVPDAEPGGAAEPQLWTEKFLPDGRLVPQDALGAIGAPEGLSYKTRVLLYVLTMGAVGAGVGAIVADRRGARMRESIVGAGIGIGLGALTALGGENR